MKVTVKGELLTTALRRARLIPNPMSNIHKIVKVEARRRQGDDPARLIFTSTAGVMAINTSIVADVSDPGTFAANTAALLTASSNMPLGDILIQTQDTKVKLKGSSGRTWSTTTADAQGMQPTPEPKGAAWLAVPVDTLKAAIDRVGYVTGDVGKYDHWRAGIRIEAMPGKLWAAACGDFMVAAFEQDTDKVSLKTPAWQGLLPTQALPAIGDIIAECVEMKTERVELYVDSTMLYVMGPATLFVAALPVGDYPPWQQVFQNFPKEPVCTVPRLALMESIRACEATGTKLDPGALMTISGMQLELSRTNDDSEYQDRVPLISMAPNTNMTFKFGMHLLYPMLKGADGDTELFFDSNCHTILVRAGGYRAAVNLMTMPEAQPPETK